jgi:osmoprotectant transport system permease protein
MSRRLATAVLLLAWACLPARAQIVIGSKQFTESVLLGEITAQLLLARGLPVEHRREMGGTRILWEALRNGEIALYPEYTGTLTNELLPGTAPADLGAALREQGLRMTRPLGFANSYVLGMREARAAALGIATISDLTTHPQLVLGLSNEFMDRQDGWPGLRQHYQLAQREVRGIQHDLAYRGLVQGEIDVIDLYSTDAEIALYDIRPLRDDRGYFPEYRAVLVYAERLEREFPQAVAALDQLHAAIDQQQMVTMNAAVRTAGESAVAGRFLRERLGVRAETRAEGRAARILRTTADHLVLVGISLGAAVAAAVPLGIAAARSAPLARVLLATVGIVQTVPSLALLVFMIPLLGIGGPPAVAALFLYSLLPIVRGTYSGLQDIPRPLRESAVALGLPSGARLRLIELPLATRSILSGVRTAAVINVGTATLGALIGAGGYGQPILTGIRLNDLGLILEGAIPAAVLALLVEGLFSLVERVALPAGLRYRPVN